MVDCMAQFLFTDTPIDAFLNANQHNLFDEIDHLTDAAILSRSNEEWLKYLINKYTMNVPSIDLSKAERTWADGLVPSQPVPNPHIDNQHGVPGRIHTLHIPYSGFEGLFYYMPRVSPMNSVIAGTANDEVTIVAGGAWFTAKTLDDHFDKTIQVIQEKLAQLRADVKPFNDSMIAIIAPRLDARRKAAEANKAITDGMKYPLRRRENAPQTYKLPEKPKPLAPRKASTAPAEWAIAEEDYAEILRICASMSLVMERSPTIFAKAEEEHIRVHYLVQLNGQYHGAATGETFNYNGKTDILIRHQGHNIFVAECKFWSGYEKLKETVDQLLGYTTWRDTRTALIIFSTRLDFTSVIAEAKRAMKDHSRYVRGPIGNEGETRFRYILRHPNDDQREVIVTLMLFDMPRPTADSKT